MSQGNWPLVNWICGELIYLNQPVGIAWPQLASPLCGVRAQPELLSLAPTGC